MQHAPPSLDSCLPMKNPCWKVEGDKQPRCLPYVYLAGSFQAGVNSLTDKLMRHPDVVTNDMTRWQFWGEEGKAMSQYVAGHGRSFDKLHESPDKRMLLDASSSTFAFYWSAGLRAHQAFQRTVRPCHHNCSTASAGDQAKHAKCMDEVCFTRAHEADLAVAAAANSSFEFLQLPVLMAAAYGPGTARLPKMLLLLRNPIDRLHSAYWSHPHYKGKYGESAQGELAYLQEQIGAMRSCEVKGHTMEECALYFETYSMEEEVLFFHADQVIRGMYAIFLERWMTHLGRDNVLVIRAEDYFAGSRLVATAPYK
ncbi:hypothetical protein FOA52_010038 [Chlamydomonas sp. UWO 241]|nr:hypothetical protein FOA52_010038 [Chlamydomonas sp. UWO 241]